MTTIIIIVLAALLVGVAAWNRRRFFKRLWANTTLTFYTENTAQYEVWYDRTTNEVIKIIPDEGYYLGIDFSTDAISITFED